MEPEGAPSKTAESIGKEDVVPEPSRDGKLSKNILSLIANRERDGPKFRSVPQDLNSPKTTEKTHNKIMVGSKVEPLFRSNESFISRLEVKTKLKGHDGCVNSIQWNKEGTLLVTGSDDCHVNVYSNSYKQLLSIETGHRRNIFCASFVPFSNNHKIISCGMDGEIRYSDISGSKPECSLISRYPHMVYKTFFVPNAPYNFLSTHQDGVIRLFDLRKENGKGAEIYAMHKFEGDSINSLAFNPLKPEQFAVVGADPFVRLCDLRFMKDNNDETEPLARYCPKSILDSPKFQRVGITGVDFGSKNEIVATYSREDAYLFNVNGERNEDGVYISPQQVYKGRRNVQTFLKEISFFADDSYVTTGSDCGHLFIWEKLSGKLVQLIKADRSVVNGVAPHPVLPLLATCGIDSTGKIIEAGEEVTFTEKYAEDVTKDNTQSSSSRFGEGGISMNLFQLFDLLRMIRGESGENEMNPRDFAMQFLEQMADMADSDDDDVVLDEDDSDSDED
eukprot:TRINITY_DN2382_c0_g1_i1.p1 TRINITY_DN2382_c0_g1~~TRINITY_DN2382_c0_g1_i1.p1  ORF type:complete len:505 (+),score=119.11 TRINITY_DN2382_c0_g1_i1:48-1562(+)